MILMAGETNNQPRTYVVFHYGMMTWNQTFLAPNNPPIIGWGDGQGKGFQIYRQPDTLTGETLIRRIDQPFTMAQVNKGNLVHKQEESGTRYYEHAGKEKIAQIEKIDELFRASEQKNGGGY